MIPEKTSENKADFPCSLQENEKNEKWSDGVTSICAKKERIIVLGRTSLPLTLLFKKC